MTIRKDDLYQALHDLEDIGDILDEIDETEGLAFTGVIEAYDKLWDFLMERVSIISGGIQ